MSAALPPLPTPEEVEAKILAETGERVGVSYVTRATDGTGDVVVVLKPSLQTIDIALGVSEPTVTTRERPSRLAIRAAMLMQHIWTPDGGREATDADRARMVDMLGATPEEVAEALAVPTG